MSTPLPYVSIPTARARWLRALHERLGLGRTHLPVQGAEYRGLG
jgi:hypothetical protein